MTQLQQLTLRRLVREIEKLDRERAVLLAERDVFIIRLVEAGWSYRRIAHLSGLSVSRVWQIWSRRPEA